MGEEMIRLSVNLSAIPQPISDGKCAYKNKQQIKKELKKPTCRGEKNTKESQLESSNCHFKWSLHTLISVKLMDNFFVYNAISVVNKHASIRVAQNQWAEIMWISLLHPFSVFSTTRETYLCLRISTLIDRWRACCRIIVSFGLWLCFAVWLLAQTSSPCVIVSRLSSISCKVFRPLCFASISTNH